DELGLALDAVQVVERAALRDDHAHSPPATGADGVMIPAHGDRGPVHLSADTLPEPIAESIDSSRQRATPSRNQCIGPESTASVLKSISTHSLRSRPGAGINGRS